MSEIQRICVQCGAGNPLEARFCTHCGYDGERSLPVPRVSLPAVIGKAALPVLVGAASLAVRAGWRLLQSRAAAAEARRSAATAAPAPLAPRVETLPARPARRTTIRIRSTWAVGDAGGVWQQGMSEHTIEIDE